MLTPKTTRSYSLMTILLGALAFNLSGWPVHHGSEESKFDQSSTSLNCEAKRQLEDPANKEAVCEGLSDGQVQGSVRVYLDQRQVRDLKDLGENGEGKVRTVREWKMVFKLVAPCAECEGGQREYQPPAESLGDPNEVDARVIEAFKKHASSLSADIKKARVQAESEQNCTEKERSKSELVQCRMDKLSTLKGEKAAQYYQDQLEGEVRAMVESDKKTDRDRAKNLLSQLNRSQNSFIRENSMDLNNYVQYREQVQMLSDALQPYRSTPNDPRAQALARQLQAMKSQWGGYFNNRFGRASQLYDSSLGDFDLRGYLTSDLNIYNLGFNNELNQAFAQVPNLHQQYVSPGSDNPINYGRTMRGMPGGPGMTAGTVYNPGQAGPMGQGQQPMNGGANPGMFAARKPMPGAFVNPSAMGGGAPMRPMQQQGVPQFGGAAGRR